MESLKEDIQNIVGYLSSLETAAIAYSGGVDSTLLLYLLAQAKLKKIISITAISPSYIETQKNFVLDITEDLGVKHVFIESKEFENEAFLKNDKDRCYFCKYDLFSQMLDFIKFENIDNLLEASHISDMEDYRPGTRAISELGVKSPFKVMAWDKLKIKEVSKYLNIPGAERGPTVCLSSRIPYGVKISEEIIEKIKRAEHYLNELGFEELRLRSDGSWARIELAEKKIDEFMRLDNRQEIVDSIRNLGFDFVSLDLEGFKSGKMNRSIKL